MPYERSAKHGAESLEKINKISISKKKILIKSALAVKRKERPSE